ncbi:hypothetical protein D3C78_1498230 [compost metagenome]
MGGTGAGWWWSTLVGVVHRVVHPLDQALQHRNLDLAADTGLLPQQYRRKDAGIGIHAGGDVGDGITRLGHLVITRATGYREETAFTLDQEVIGFLLLVGPASAVAGNVTDDQPGEALMQRLETQTQAGGGAGCQVLHQHIGLLQQLIEDAAGDLLLEVQGEAFL